ncbi:hypothetical protein O0I10_006486 [Lichtheimia ornata]|uniref:Uncharacterized protein n=1 Tax=Lichtheimia ornata TaxID=688661 RepID=A0AAD7V4V2_9FUNG|nr:uncharacterized protein O0I10_006486 [Lichtheimia ornata]KAJ8657671.1 hypothetical protein O0I10_006486 [Lichtheimia ornata]
MTRSAALLTDNSAKLASVKKEETKDVKNIFDSSITTSSPSSSRQKETAVSTPDYLSAKFEELAIESSADERPNATTVIDYLTGSGQERPEIGDKPLETWVVDNIDITSKLMEFRARSLSLAKRLKNISDARIMSLNFIFPFHDDVLPYDGLPETIVKELGMDQGFEAAADQSIVWCHRVQQAIGKGKHAVRRELHEIEGKLLDSPQDEQSLAILDILRDTSIKLANWQHGSITEDTFCRQHLQDFIDHCISFMSGIRYSWSGRQRLQCDAKGKAASMAIHLPDYIASIQTRSEKIFHDVFVIEAKKPHASSGQQLLNDRCKLALEMKKMLDAMVDARVPSPVVCGLLVEGHECTSYKMEMVSEAVYALTRLAEFSLLRGQHDLATIVSTVQYCWQLRNIIASLQKRVLDGVKDESKASWKRPHFDKPIRKNKAAAK